MLTPVSSGYTIVVLFGDLSGQNISLLSWEIDDLMIWIVEDSIIKFLDQFCVSMFRNEVDDDIWICGNLRLTIF